MCGGILKCVFHDTWLMLLLLQEYQLMVGLSNAMLWVSYFVTFLLMYLIIICLLCGILFLKASIHMYTAHHHFQREEKWRCGKSVLVCQRVNVFCPDSTVYVQKAQSIRRFSDQVTGPSVGNDFKVSEWRDSLHWGQPSVFSFTSVPFFLISSLGIKPAF